MAIGRILVVDDDKKIVESCRLYLEHAGYEVIPAYNGTQALQECEAFAPDLIVLDLLLPRLDGREVCRHLRAAGARTPILMLTALACEQDRVAGLDLGADDYLAKPFSPRELVARVRAILRRSPAPEPERAVSFDGLRLDFERRDAIVAETPAGLTRKEFALLASLARRPQRAFSRAQLVEQALGDETDVLERTVDVHIMNLRRKIEADPASPRFVVTVHGVGYRFEGTPST
ncbi:MAG: response regulator transcription factor [Candidatus Eisenbacteria bacterium]